MNNLGIHRHPIYQTIYNLVKDIVPFDSLEVEHIQDALQWIKSGSPIFRTQKPDIPNKHLVSYILPFDETQRKLLLTEHKNSGLWLPPGGHVDFNEHPKETAIRECKEELDVNAVFWNEHPLFLTSTIVKNNLHTDLEHADVSFWYVLKENCDTAYNYDPREFHSVRWFHFDDIPYDETDPHMKRFIEKLKQRL